MTVPSALAASWPASPHEASPLLLKTHPFKTPLVVADRDVFVTWKIVDHLFFMLPDSVTVAL